MSAAGRLWRRAPLWRLCVFGCLGFGAMALLYPSPLYGALLARARLGGPAPVAPDDQAMIAPPFDPVFRDRIAFAGRALALPPGDWHRVLSGRTTRLEEVNLIALARVDSGTLTGLVLAIGSVSPPPPGRPFALDPQCASPANFAGSDGAGQAVAADASGIQTCWYVRRVDLDAGSAAGAAGLEAEPDVAAAERRLASLGVTVPPLRALSVWNRIEPNDAQRETFYQPGPPAPDDTALASAAAWMRGPGRVAFARAYDGDPAPATARAQARRGRAAREASAGGNPAE